MENAQEEPRGNQSNWSFPFHRHTHTRMDHFKAFGGAEFVPSSIAVETDLPVMFHFQNQRGLYCPPALHMAFFKKQIKVLL